jgi:glyoxylase-like metal-dependent hydrolase (beta-lactamase superfamily II)
MRKVASGVYEVSLPRRGTPVNAYLIAGDSLVLIDTGVPGRWGHLVNAIREIRRDPAEVRHIGITHHHIDHLGSLASVVEHTGAEVFAHANEAGLIDGSVVPPVKIGRSLSSRVRIWASDRIGWTQAAPAAVDHRVADGAEMAGTGLRAIHTPGHTAGHLAFIHSASGVLFVGDAAANVLGRLSKPIGDHDEDSSAMIASVAKLAQLEFDTACFGHGRPIPSGARRRLTELAERLSG